MTDNKGGKEIIIFIFIIYAQVLVTEMDSDGLVKGHVICQPCHCSVVHFYPMTR